MILHQPDDETGVAGGQAVGLAEALGVHRTQFRVVAAAPLADIMVKPGDVEQLYLGQSAGDPAGYRKAFLVGRDVEAPHILYDFQRMGVNGVSVE